MQFERPPRGEQPTPAGILLERTFGIYAYAFKPMVLTAGVAAFIANAFDLIIRPGNDFLAAVTYFVLNGVTSGLLVAVMRLAILSREGAPLTSAAVYESIRLYGARYIGGSVLLVMTAGLLSMTFVGIPLAIFLLIRLSLYGPSILVEEADLTDAFTRSWVLVKDRWWRTLGIFIAGGAPLIVLLFFLLLIRPPAVVTFVLATGGWALVAPFVTVLTLLVFEDYKRIADADEDPFHQPPDTL